MSKESKGILIFLAIVIVVLIGIALFCKHYQATHKTVFTFPTTTIVDNTTSVPYLDTLALVMLNKILHYDTIKVIILNMPDEEFEGSVLSAYVDKDPQVPHQYWMHINPVTARDHSVLMIAHECIHIQQAESGRLVKLSSDEVKFDNDTIVYDLVPYMERKFEIEAYKAQDGYAKILNKLIYHK